MTVKMTEDFTKALDSILAQVGVQKVSKADATIIHMRLVEDIKKIEKARGGFEHEWITLKSKGRLVIPKNLRTAIGAVEGTRFDAHLFPNPQNPRGIALIKER